MNGPTVRIKPMRPSLPYNRYGPPATSTGRSRLDAAVAQFAAMRKAAAGPIGLPVTSICPADAPKPVLMDGFVGTSIILPTSIEPPSKSSSSEPTVVKPVVLSSAPVSVDRTAASTAVSNPNAIIVGESATMIAAKEAVAQARKAAAAAKIDMVVPTDTTIITIPTDLPTRPTATAGGVDRLPVKIKPTPTMQTQPATTNVKAKPTPAMDVKKKPTPTTDVKKKPKPTMQPTATDVKIESKPTTTDVKIEPTPTMRPTTTDVKIESKPTMQPTTTDRPETATDRPTTQTIDRPTTQTTDQPTTTQTTDDRSNKTDVDQQRRSDRRSSESISNPRPRARIVGSTNLNTINDRYAVVARRTTTDQKRRSSEDDDDDEAKSMPRRRSSRSRSPNRNRTSHSERPYTENIYDDRRPIPRFDRTVLRLRGIDLYLSQQDSESAIRRFLDGIGHQIVRIVRLNHVHPADADRGNAFVFMQSNISRNDMHDIVSKFHRQSMPDFPRRYIECQSVTVAEAQKTIDDNANRQLTGDIEPRRSRYVDDDRNNRPSAGRNRSRSPPVSPVRSGRGGYGFGSRRSSSFRTNAGPNPSSFNPSSSLYSASSSSSSSSTVSPSISAVNTAWPSAYTVPPPSAPLGQAFEFQQQMMIYQQYLQQQQLLQTLQLPPAFGLPSTYPTTVITTPVAVNSRDPRLRPAEADLLVPIPDPPVSIPDRPVPIPPIPTTTATTTEPSTVLKPTDFALLFQTLQSINHPSLGNIKQPSETERSNQL